MTKIEINKLSYEVVGAAIEVHKNLGPGLLESVYEKCLYHELTLRGFYVTKQQRVPINYKGLELNFDLRFDLLVENQIIVEIKAIEKLIPLNQAQLLTYLRLLGKSKGVLLNFNCINIFKEGQKTIVTEKYWKLKDS